MNRITFDIDIDFPDRDRALSYVGHIPASIVKDGVYTKHTTGVYPTDIPTDPITGLSSIDYVTAENMGYMKLDMLNVSVYEQVRDEDHLTTLMNTEPMWEMLSYREFVEQVIHINGQYDILRKLPEPVNSIPRMAMFISAIRPAKRHLLGKPWKEVAMEVWKKPTDGGYYYKRSHAISYSMLVAVHMNLLCGI